MTTRHTVSYADEIYAGDAYDPAYTPDGRHGVLVDHLKAVTFGAIATAAPTGICNAATATGAATLSATGSLVSGGIATFDVPRNVSLTSTSNNSGVTFTITGKDYLGYSMTEAVVGPNNTTVYGAKAFKTVSSVASGAAVTGNISAGSGTSYGLPFRVGAKSDVFGVYVDSVPETTLTVTAGLSASGTSTATTADVRGTVLPNTAANGTKVFSALIRVDHTSRANAFGAAQA